MSNFYEVLKESWFWLIAALGSLSLWEYSNRNAIVEKRLDVLGETLKQSEKNLSEHMKEDTEMKISIGKIETTLERIRIDIQEIKSSLYDRR